MCILRKLLAAAPGAHGSSPRIKNIRSAPRKRLIFPETGNFFDTPTGRLGLVRGAGLRRWFAHGAATSSGAAASLRQRLAAASFFRPVCPRPPADASRWRRWPLLAIGADDFYQIDKSGRRYRPRVCNIRQIAFGGLSLNLLDLTPEKNRDLFDAASEREGTIEIEQVFFGPRLLAVVFGPDTSEMPRYFSDSLMATSLMARGDMNATPKFARVSQFNAPR
jgi:hypothetical protein